MSEIFLLLHSAHDSAHTFSIIFKLIVKLEEEDENATFYIIDEVLAKSKFKIFFLPVLSVA